MYRNAFAIAFFTLGLTACSEESTPTNPPANTPAVNPQPVVTPTTPSGPVLDDPGISNGGGTLFPTGDAGPVFPVSPVNAPINPSVPTTGSSTQTVDTSLLINGSNAGSVQSFWRCEAPFNTDPNAYFDVNFFPDGSGTLGVSGQSASLVWSASGDDITLSDPQVGTDSVALANVEFVQSSEFEATLNIPGNGSVSVVCTLLDNNANPINNPSNQPTVTPIDPLPIPGPTTDGSLVNGATLSTAGSFWLCYDDSGNEYALIFTSDGQGQYVDTDFPDGIALSWSQSSNVNIAFETGEAVTLTTPQFSAGTSFYVDAVIANGSSLGATSCELYNL